MFNCQDKKTLTALSALLALLLAALAVCGCARTTAVIENGDFEQDSASGVPSSWSANLYYEDCASVGIASDAAYGSVARITASEPNDARLCQTVKVSPNTAYTLSCMVRTSGVEGGAGANVGVYGVPVSSEGVYGDSDWQRVELTGRTAEGQTELVVSVGIGSHGALASGEAWFDGVSIAPANDVEGIVSFGSASPDAINTEKTTGGGLFPTANILKGAAAATAVMLVIWLLHLSFAKKPYKAFEKGKGKTAAVISILLLALAVRVALSLIFYGHKTDINCFVLWGKRIAEHGAAEFYGKLVTENGVTSFAENWCDYPPGYMLVLGLMYKIGSLFNASADGYALCIKLPCIIADLACAYLVYAYAKRRMRFGAALTLMSLVAFCPVIAYVSSAWGQIDQVLALLLLLPILLLYERKPIWAGLVYGAAIIIKPQALMAGPLFAAAYLIYVFKGSPYKKLTLKKGRARLLMFRSDTVGLRLAETALAVLAAVAVIFIVSAPFRGDQPWYWLINKYYGTATSYDYATVNAYNFWALIGANWAKTSTPFMGLTYGKWGTVFMAVSVVLSISAYVFAALKHKSCKGALPLTMAFMFAGIFTFGHYMHERYIFPALLLLVFAYIFYNDRRILWSYMLYSATILVNCLAAFYYSYMFDVYKVTGDGGAIFDYDLIKVCSAASIVAFLLLTYVTFDLVIRNKPLRGYNG